MQRQGELRVKCSKSEEKALRLLAEREGIPHTDKLRDLVRDAAKQAGIWPVREGKNKAA